MTSIFMNLNIDQAYREGSYTYSSRVKRILHLEIGEGLGGRHKEVTIKVGVRFLLFFRVPSALEIHLGTFSHCFLRQVKGTRNSGKCPKIGSTSLLSP
jgi:hypothetical protein